MIFVLFYLVVQEIDFANFFVFKFSVKCRRDIFHIFLGRANHCDFFPLIERKFILFGFGVFAVGFVKTPMLLTSLKNL